ncbi:hypothetical protein [Actinoplanes sp. M2I2]|uniref:LppU/SCO3897 family protein n=1 Tax=Actinoplanes sp. M2I2 TaxID=1734444 RepID=UPI0020223AA6|nr:hypothetical protein [Actinoplanes sp. M2I2]
MSNPVPPPADAQPGYAEPAGPPRFPRADDARPGPFAEPGKKGGGAGKLITGIVVAVVLVVAAFALRAVFSGDDNAQDAKAGDCIASDKDVKNEGTTETGANVVDCGSAEAKFTVVARVDGESSPQSKACDKFFTAEEVFYVFASGAGDGYVLCLRPKA